MSASDSTPATPSQLAPGGPPGTTPGAGQSSIKADRKITELAGPRLADGGPGPDPGEQQTMRKPNSLEARLAKLERQNRLGKLLLLLLLVGGAFSFLSSSLGDGLVVKRTLMESHELKLLDDDGTARLFLRMYSRVPVMQIMDSSGRPRISLGLRFDDSPFLVLSDVQGNKRFSLEMEPDGDAALRLLDESGDVKFSLQ